MNPLDMTEFVTSLLLDEWLEHPCCARKVMGSIHSGTKRV